MVTHSTKTKNIAIIVTFTIEKKKFKLEIRSYIKKKNEKTKRDNHPGGGVLFSVVTNSVKKKKMKKKIIGSKRRRIIVRRKSPDTLHTKEIGFFVFFFSYGFVS